MRVDLGIRTSLFGNYRLYYAPGMMVVLMMMVMLYCLKHIFSRHCFTGVVWLALIIILSTARTDSVYVSHRDKWEAPYTNTNALRDMDMGYSCVEHFI